MLSPIPIHQGRSSRPTFPPEDLLRALLENSHFRALVENSFDALHLMNAEGRVLYANPSTEKVLGYLPGEVQGRDSFEFVHPEDVAFARANLSACLRQPGSYRVYELRIRHKGDFWVAVECVAVNHLLDSSIGAIMVTCRDITERRSTEQLRSLLASIVEHSDDAIIGMNLKGTITIWNQGAVNLYGYSAHEAVGQSIYMLSPPERAHEYAEILDKIAQGERIDNFETVRLAKGGAEIHVSLTASPLRDAQGKVIGVSSIARDITRRRQIEEELRQAENGLQALLERSRHTQEALRRSQERVKQALEKEREIARQDFLTGLLNRRAFQELMEFETKRMQRHERPITLCYIDLDNFKQVNDVMGHEAGDELLVFVAGVIKSAVRKSDVVARLGGDEFAILLPETDPEAAKACIGKLHATLVEAMRNDCWPLVTFSIGTVTFVNPPASSEEAVRRGDEAMYSVKRLGKNSMNFAVA